jgi:GrpB-like predicted nucleotidyltransferase (UPF0157 family)
MGLECQDAAVRLLTRLRHWLGGGERWTPLWVLAATIWAMLPALRSVELRPHDREWAEAFRKEAARLSTVLAGVALAVEHIGSTAVPGLAAKPTVDIQIIVEDVDPQDRYDSQLAKLGYVNFGRDMAHTADQRLYRSIASRRFHVWVRSQGSVDAAQARLFRDLLCADTSLASSYADLKASLAAAAHHRRRDLYAVAKTDFITRALQGDPAGP